MLSNLDDKFIFNPVEGTIHWRKTMKRAGTFSKERGYRIICVDYKLYKEHRLMWFYVYGRWPKEIDHINGKKDDNRIENLRETDDFGNNTNRFRQSNNTSGFKGVSFHVRIGKWQARIGTKKQRIHLGYFDTPEEAYAAYCTAAPVHHGEFARM